MEAKVTISFPCSDDDWQKLCNMRAMFSHTGTTVSNQESSDESSLLDALDNDKQTFVDEDERKDIYVTPSMPVKAKTMLQKIIEIVAQNPGLSRPELAHKVVEKYPNMYFGSVNSSLSYLHNRGKINVPAIKHFQYNSNNS